jgi:signal transduction histidine kinase
MSEQQILSGTTKIDHLFGISKIVYQAAEWKPALDAIVQLVRSFFIFDNLVVYINDPHTQTLDVMYARAVGRGRHSEADAAWGESFANKIILNRATMLEEPDLDPNRDRIKQPFFLGVPLNANQRCQGALIFIRFGGPKYDTDNMNLAEFIAQQIAILVDRQNLQQEYEILEARHKLAQFQEDFISTISHELRSPLGYIKGYTTTLLRSDTTWDLATTQEFLQIIDAETDHLQELITNLLDSARLQSGQLRMTSQPVDLERLINDVISRITEHHPNLVIRVTKPRQLPPIQGDPNRLAQVFENLFSNAEKYAPGSEVVVSLKPLTDGIRVTVQDHGPGVPERYMPFLFDRFFRAPNQPNIHGSGLGLFICRLIIHAHNGKISVLSKEGEGTRFSVFLPFQSSMPTPVEFEEV